MNGRMADGHGVNVTRGACPLACGADCRRARPPRRGDGTAHPQVCENEVAEILQVIGSEQVREREKERERRGNPRRKRDEDTAARRAVSLPLLSPLPACCCIFCDPQVPLALLARMPSCECARNEVCEAFRLAGLSGGTDLGQTLHRRLLGPTRRGAAWRGAAQRLLLSLSFGNSQLTHFSLVRRPSPFASLPTYACSLEFAGMRCAST